MLDPAFRELLGYAPRADVLLERDDGTRRLWIEFEVSRADPVANHAKFATSHLFQPQADTDAFVAMVSSHVNLDESEPRFDGNRAQAHLRKNLGMNTVEPNDAPAITNHFETWLKNNSAFITVHPRGPRFLVPPDWFK